MNNGGPAFPQTDNRVVAALSIANSQGMTLRDYFAAKALQGVLAADTEELLSVDAIASVSYRIADAMLKERNK
jgi:hypothetical protein